MPAADVGLHLLGIALRLIQGADPADELDGPEGPHDGGGSLGEQLVTSYRGHPGPEADATRARVRALLALLDADGPLTTGDVGVRRNRLPASGGPTTAPPPAPTPTPDGTRRAPRTPRMAIWCFGGFRMTIGDRTVDWRTIRPRARAAMRLLALRAGRPVHREALVDALWPEAPPESAMANLQVAISSLRRLLEPDRERRKPQLVVRTGDAYLLNLPADAYLDTLAFETALTRSRRARSAGDTSVAVGGLRDALASYHGELLPEDGPAEWLQQDREMYRRQAANAAAELATAELAADNPREAVAAAEKCLAIDAFHDTGWQLLVRAHQRVGAPAAAERARRRYLAMLASLGIGSDEPGLPGHC
ncbi:BTAD domain-containing putative transcriptional regulator [Streptomyces sp. NPDC048506]|uniref:AfsR/SARP family transcriptional regulator n=1 Tax=Streptomyces sp. NPDC048506 TaxID=3155028 RepID=UPI003423B9CB